MLPVFQEFILFERIANLASNISSDFVKTNHSSQSAERVFRNVILGGAIVVN
jgi:hypothetical protein